MSLDSIRLSKKEIRNVDQKVKNRGIQIEAYNNFIAGSQKYFLESVEVLEEKIGEEILNGNLYINTVILSRIKDQESAFNNDDLSLMEENMLMKIIADSIDYEDYTVEYLESEYIPTEKILDDVFGITIIVDTDDEKNKVKRIIEKTFKITEEKQMKKEEYKAIHLKMYKDECFESPLIECQIKTNIEDRGAREHTIYKVESTIERKLRAAGKLDNPNKKVKITLTEKGILKVYKIIQNYFENGKFKVGCNIPDMWESRFNEEEEIMKRRKLSEGQTLKRMYKFLNMTRNRRKEGESR